LYFRTHRRILVSYLSYTSKNTQNQVSENYLMNRIIVTGGAGFIGSAVARHIINDTAEAVCVVNKLTCAGNFENLGQYLLRMIEE